MEAESLRLQQIAWEAEREGKREKARMELLLNKKKAILDIPVSKNDAMRMMKNEEFSMKNEEFLF